MGSLQIGEIFLNKYTSNRGQYPKYIIHGKKVDFKDTNDPMEKCDRKNSQ